LAVMKAVVKMRPESGAHLTEVPVPEPGPREVLVRIKATSVCGTDLHIYEWNEWAAANIRPPLTMGHEFAGEVVAAGPSVEKVKVGDYVSAETHVPCGRCYQCETGRMHICRNMKILGVHLDGAFAEYVVVPEIDVRRNPTELPPEIASVQEPLGNAVDTVLAEDVAGKSVLVAGCGPAGLFSVGVAAASGATLVVATDLEPYRLELARRMGAHVTLDARTEDVVRQVLARTDGKGVDVFCEVSGSEHALRDGLRALTPGGRASLLGLYSSSVTVDLNDLVIFKGITVYGVTGRKMFSTWHKVANFLASGTVDVSPVITHTLRLEEFEQAMELMQSGKCGKIVLMP